MRNSWDSSFGIPILTFSLGADYKLAKSTKLYVFYTDNTDSSVGSADSENSAFGLGMEHKF